MANLPKEQLLALAKAKYEECEQIIEIVAQAVTKATGSDYEKEGAMVCFDFIVQSCLFNAAVVDGQLELAEIELIKVVSKYADLISLINEEFKKEDSNWQDISWQSLTRLPSKTQEALALHSASLVSQHATSFAKLFGLMDKVMEKTDLLQVLNERVFALFVALSGVDGEDLGAQGVKAESTRALIIYNKLVIEEWKKAQ